MDAVPNGSTDDDVAAAAAPARVRVAGAIVLMAGAFGVMHVVQIFGVITFIRGPFAVVPYVLAVETATAVVAGVGLARARAWAPWTAIATAALLAVTAAAWFLFALANGLFTFFGMLVPALAALSFALALVAKRPCEVAAAARKRLERAGFELGV
jgi:hypothetical protein